MEYFVATGICGFAGTGRANNRRLASGIAIRASCTIEQNTNFVQLGKRKKHKIPLPATGQPQPRIIFYLKENVKKRHNQEIVIAEHIFIRTVFFQIKTLDDENCNQRNENQII